MRAGGRVLIANRLTSGCSDRDRCSLVILGGLVRYPKGTKLEAFTSNCVGPIFQIPSAQKLTRFLELPLSTTRRKFRSRVVPPCSIAHRMLLIRRHSCARRQADDPLTLLSDIVEPALSASGCEWIDSLRVGRRWGRPRSGRRERGHRRGPNAARDRAGSCR